MNQLLDELRACLPGDELRLRLRPPLEHQSNRLYDVLGGERDLIAKEYLNPAEAEDAPRREYDGLVLLRQADFAPRPVCRIDASEQHGPVVVYEFMTGQMWDRRCPAPAELAALAEIWLKMHAMPVEGLWMSRGYERSLVDSAPRWQGLLQDYSGWAAENFPAGLPAAQQCLALLPSRHVHLALLDAMPPMVCFCRGDARFANVIARPGGGLGLVDWEDCGLRDPARDLADLLTCANQEDLLSPQAWQPFLTPYLDERLRVDPRLPERLHLYRGCFPLFWLAVLLGHGVRRAREGRLAGWTINGLAVNVRLRRYLARALAWPDEDFANHLDDLSELAFFPDA